MSKNAFDKAMGSLLEDPVLSKRAQRQQEIIRMAKMLRKWRTQADYTQTELSERSGLPQSTIARMESPNNTSLPNVETIIAFAHGCGHPAVIGTPADLAARVTNIEDSMAVSL